MSGKIYCQSCGIELTKENSSDWAAFKCKDCYKKSKKNEKRR